MPAAVVENAAFFHELEYYGLAEAFFGAGWYVPGVIFAVGGWTAEGASRTTELFRPDIGAFVGAPVLPLPPACTLPSDGRCNTGIAVMEDRVFITGGSFSAKAEALGSVDVFYLRRRTWSNVAPMLTPRCVAGMIPPPSKINIPHPPHYAAS